MNDTKSSATPVDQVVTGEPIEAHGYVVTPVARVRGRLGTSDTADGRGRYGWVAIRPVKVTATDRSGNTQDVRIVNVEQQALSGMAAAGIAVAAITLLISLLARARRG